MSVSKRNYIRGDYETITAEPVGSPVLDEWTYFVLDGFFKFEVADVSLSQGGSPIPSSAYELAIDEKWTAEEAKSGGTASTLYKMFRVTDVTYAGIATTIAGKNFGSMVDNEAVWSVIGKPVGETYIQMPFHPTPASLYGGTWTDITAKASGYELSVSGWVSRADVGQPLWTETDYVPTDTVSGSPGGAYDGETVDTVFTVEGQTIRFSGGLAATFETGTQLDSMQGHWHNLEVNNGAPGGVTATPTGNAGAVVYTLANRVKGPVTDGTNGTPRTAAETRMTNFTVVFWKRTA